MKQALGLIETIGLAAAIEAADAAIKAANVTLLGYENTKGSGKITVKIAGSVSAVKAGIAAGAASAARVGEVYGQSVIPRPHDEIEALIRNLDRGPSLDEPEPAEIEPDVNEPEPDVEEPQSAPEAPAEEAPQRAEESEPKQCAAITKSGSRCKLQAQPGSDYCHVHGG
jgi:microcompartment protein CcmL/EutN